MNPIAWAAMVLFGLIGAGGGWLYGDWTATREERARCYDRMTAAAVLAERQARDVEREKLREKEIVDENYRVEVQNARDAAGRARAQLDRLRAQLAARDRAGAANPGAQPGADGAAAERSVLGSCATEYRDMAEDADAVARRLRGLQAYVATVCKSE